MGIERPTSLAKQLSILIKMVELDTGDKKDGQEIDVFLKNLALVYFDSKICRNPNYPVCMQRWKLLLLLIYEQIQVNSVSRTLNVSVFNYSHKYHWYFCKHIANSKYVSLNVFNVYIYLFKLHMSSFMCKNVQFFT